MKRSYIKRKTPLGAKLSKGIKKPARSKKPSVAKLKKVADTVFSQYVRIRDSDSSGFAQCITCDVSKPWKELQNGHFVSRGCNLLRYDELNCNAQCVGCNMFKNGNLFQYGLALDMKYGDGTAKRLHAQRFATHKLTIEELQKIIDDCKMYINETNH